MEHLKKISYLKEFDGDIKVKLEAVYDSIFALTVEDDGEADERLSRYLGEIACSLSGEQVDSKGKMIICSKLYEIMNRGSDEVVLKIKNFFEIASTMDEQILCWLDNLQLKNSTKNRYASALITQIIISSRIRRGELEAAERRIDILPENYYGYKELSTYYLFIRDFIKSLYYINKAIKNSPIHLKSYFLRRRKDIVFMMEE